MLAPPLFKQDVSVAFAPVGDPLKIFTIARINFVGQKSISATFVFDGEARLDGAVLGEYG